MNFGAKEKLITGATAGLVSAKLIEEIGINIGAGVAVEMLKKIVGL